ncbi:MAG: DNA gyrase/topoisomerase IV subunit A, partial [bacterium]
MMDDRDLTDDKDKTMQDTMQEGTEQARAQRALPEGPATTEKEGTQTTHIQELYKDWFLDYASYVILERAVPDIKDGLKPVQRRILYSMKRMEDGRFNKVANIIGHTMQFHPHGDAAIGDAIVLLGQKDLLIETQGNWGDVCTGDQAAAPRYIEARLSRFALEVAFNDKTTKWQLSYDGRKREPVHLPVKFPLLLAQGVEGIAVGLSTRILPHNFIELIDASIDILKGKPVHIVPDFPTGGLADFSNYNEGLKGGKVRIRTRIETLDKKTLVIREVPYGVTTSTLIDSIVKANEGNKIKIKKVIDNTAKDVEIVVELPPGVSPDITIDALYAFTNCEISVSPNTCVIIDEKPLFMSVNEILELSTHNTVALLRHELEIKRGELFEKLHLASLEKIFIEKRIYRDIEKCETWESIVETIDKGLEPYKPLFVRDVTEEDIAHLTQIIIKRISRFDSIKADQNIASLKDEISRVEYNLDHLTDYSISYFESLKKKYGAGRERKTEIRSFDIIKGAHVAVANQKLYVNRKEGFIGYSLKKDEFVCECSDLDDIIIFFKDGTFMVTRVSEKAFVGKDIIYAAVWKKNDTRMIYHMIYSDGESGVNYAKRFPVNAITRDKLYSLTKSSQGTKLVYFTANPNSQSEVVTIYLSPASHARKKVFDFDFAGLSIKGRSSQGNIVSKHQIKKVVHKEAGGSTLGGVDIWYDETIGRLNTEDRGEYLGSFEGGDTILVIQKNGAYLLTSYELTNRYEPENILIIKKFN